MFPGILKKESVKIGMEFKTELIKVTLPPIEMFLPFHEESRLLTLLTTSNHTFFLLGLSPTMIPRNLKGATPFLQERKVNAAFMYHSPTFTPIILLLEKLILNPETNSNPLKITFKFQILSQDASPRIIVSSANCKMSTLSVSPYIKGLKFPTSTDFFTRAVNPSMAMTKRKGDKGSPCLNPLCTLNSLVALPLTNTDM